MDLSRLKIERAAEAARTVPTRARRRTSPWFMRIVFFAVVLGLAWTFKAPIIGFVDRFRLPLVETAKAERRSAGQAAAASGTAANGYVVARVRAALSADTPGRIVELNVTEGMAVKKGFVIARLYSEDAEAAMRRAEANLAAAEATAVSAGKDTANWEEDAARIKVGISTLQADVAEAEALEKRAALDYNRAKQLVESEAESVERLEQLAADYDAAKAHTASAKTRLDQVKTAFTQAQVTKVEWAKAVQKEAEAQLPVRKAERDQAAALLDKLVIRAPFDGIIVLKEAEVGEVVAPSVQAGGSARGAVVTMVDFKTLEAQAEVPETTLKSVKREAPATMFLDAYPDHAYHGSVQRIWPTADRQKATVEVRVSIDDPDENLRPEMGVRVVFSDSADAKDAKPATTPDADPTPVLMVPEDALVHADGKAFVFVLERDTVHERTLKLGGKTGGRYVVESGLDDAETVVLNPPSSLRDGDRVRVKDRG